MLIVCEFCVKNFLLEILRGGVLYIFANSILNPQVDFLEGGDELFTHYHHFESEEQLFFLMANQMNNTPEETEQPKQRA